MIATVGELTLGSLFLEVLNSLLESRVINQVVGFNVGFVGASAHGALCLLGLGNQGQDGGALVRVTTIHILDRVFHRPLGDGVQRGTSGLGHDQVLLSLLAVRLDLAAAATLPLFLLGLYFSLKGLHHRMVLNAQLVP